jgi:hypothetical protein
VCLFSISCWTVEEPSVRAHCHHPRRINFFLFFFLLLLNSWRTFCMSSLSSSSPYQFLLPWSSSASKWVRSSSLCFCCCCCFFRGSVALTDFDSSFHFLPLLEAGKVKIVSQRDMGLVILLRLLNNQCYNIIGYALSIPNQTKLICAHGWQNLFTKHFIFYL